jgi:hypothetical protein
MSITVHDWENTRRAHLEDVPANASVAEILEEARRLMGLSADTPYKLLRGERQLNGMDSLADAGIEPADDLEILPEVHAG